jgi:hypothetical protein
MGQPANVFGPAYLDANGNPLSQIVCGGSYTFDVPGSGLDHVQITVYKNGAIAYQGIEPIPIPYTTVCNQDEATYQTIAYDPITGANLGQTAIVILPAGSTVTGGGTTGTGIAARLQAWFAGLTTAEKAGLAAAVGFILYKRRKK